MFQVIVTQVKVAGGFPTRKAAEKWVRRKKLDRSDVARIELESPEPHGEFPRGKPAEEDAK